MGGEGKGHGDGEGWRVNERGNSGVEISEERVNGN